MNRRRQKKLTARLFEAVLRGDTTRVGALLRAGAAPERADREGTTPLYEAAVNGEAGIVRLLLAAGAPPDADKSRAGGCGVPMVHGWRTSRRIPIR